MFKEGVEIQVDIFDACDVWRNINGNHGTGLEAEPSIYIVLAGVKANAEVVVAESI